MMKIVTDVASKTQNVDILQQWMEAFTEKLVEEQRNGTLSLRRTLSGLTDTQTTTTSVHGVMSGSNPSFATTIINEIVLKRMPWFELTSVHNKSLFGVFERYVLQMLSISSTTPSSTSMLTSVYRMLLSHIFMKDVEPVSSAMGEITGMAIKIGGHTFNDRGSLINYVYGILNNPQYETRAGDGMVDVVGDDAVFLMELFKFHPRSEFKLHDTVAIKIGTNEEYESRTRCFFLAKTSGKTDAISYVKSCDSAVAFHQDAHASRFIQEDQMKFINHLITFLTKILNIYPLSATFLPQLITEMFPYKAERQNYIVFCSTIVLRLATVYLTTPNSHPNHFHVEMPKDPQTAHETPH